MTVKALINLNVKNTVCMLKGTADNTAINQKSRSTVKSV